MANWWEQNPLDQGQAIDQLGPYQPELYDQPAPEPEQEFYNSYGPSFGLGATAGRETKLGHAWGTATAGAQADAERLKRALADANPFGDYVDPEAGKVAPQGWKPPAAAIDDANIGPSSHEEVPPAPSIAQDPKTGALIGSGHFNGEITPNSRAGAFTGGPSSFNEAGGSSFPTGQTANWGTPDVSLAGMMNDRRARGMIQQGYEQRQHDIDFPADNERRQALQAAQVQKAQNEADDPYQLGGYAQRKAIDLRTSALDRKAQQDEDNAAYAGKRQAFERALRAVDADPKNAALTEAQKAELRRKAQDDFDADWLAYRQGRAAGRPGALNKEYYGQT